MLNNVAPHMGCVDLNRIKRIEGKHIFGRTPCGCVDLNGSYIVQNAYFVVAPLTVCVD